MGLGKAALVELHVNQVVILIRLPLAALVVFLDVARVHDTSSLWLTYLLRRLLLFIFFCQHLPKLLLLRLLLITLRRFIPLLLRLRTFLPFFRRCWQALFLRRNLCQCCDAFHYVTRFPSFLLKGVVTACLEQLVETRGQTCSIRLLSLDADYFRRRFCYYGFLGWDQGTQTTLTLLLIGGSEEGSVGVRSRFFLFFFGWGLCQFGELVEGGFQI